MTNGTRNADRVLVTWRNADTVRLLRGEAEAVGKVAGLATAETAGQDFAARVATEASQGGLD